jgi:two-component system, chemotaxis family, CheB/CheR fusion protein
MLSAGAEELKQDKETYIEEFAQKMLMESFAPPCVIVDGKGDILYVHGRTGKYLEPAIGKASLNIITMAREGIRYELCSAVNNAVKQKKDITYKGLKVKINGGIQTINLTVKPFREPKTKRTVMLVIFEDVPVKQVETKKTTGTSKDAQSKRIDVLE